MSVLPFYRTQLCASPTFAEMPARILLPPEEEPLEIFIRKVVSFDDAFDDEMFHATVLQLFV